MQVRGFSGTYFVAWWYVIMIQDAKRYLWPSNTTGTWIAHRTRLDNNRRIL
jgi:hypothetical protein